MAGLSKWYKLVVCASHDISMVLKSDIPTDDGFQAVCSIGATTCSIGATTTTIIINNKKRNKRKKNTNNNICIYSY